MQSFRRLIACASAIGCVLTAGLASAQTSLSVLPADLAVPFGSTKGQLVLLDEQIVFVDAGRPDASFAMRRDGIASLTRDGDTVEITTTSPARDRSGERTRITFRASAASEVDTWFNRRPAMAAVTANNGQTAAQSEDALETFQARHDHRIGSCQGTLVITETRIAFESVSEINDSRQWVYTDIKEIGQDGIYSLRIEPFVGNSYNFELLAKGMDSRVYRELADRIARARATQ